MAISEQVNENMKNQLILLDGKKKLEKWQLFLTEYLEISGIPEDFQTSHLKGTIFKVFESLDYIVEHWIVSLGSIEGTK